MNKLHIFFIFLSLLSINLQAEQKGFIYSITSVGMRMDYHEYNDNKDILDSEKSDFSDIVGSEIGIDYIFHATAQDYAQVGLKVMKIGGTTDYTGAILGSKDGYGSAYSRTKNSILNFDISYLHGYTLNKYFDLLSACSFGYRTWERRLLSYQIETYTWTYLNPELGLKVHISDALQLRLMVGCKYAMNPIMEVSVFRSDFKLGSTNTYHTSLETQYKVSEHSYLSLGYFYEMQVIQQSNKLYDSDGTGYLEPDSMAKNQYIKIGVVFKY